MAELEGDVAAELRLVGAPDERLDDTRAGAPGDVKARHRIAVAGRVVAAALGPADHREDAVAHRAQPAAFFARGKLDIGLGPLLRPMIFVAVEAGGAPPVLQRELDANP